MVSKLLIFYDTTGLWLIRQRNGQQLPHIFSSRLCLGLRLSGLPEEAAPQIQTFKRLCQNFFRQSSQEVLIAILEGASVLLDGLFPCNRTLNTLTFYFLLSVPWCPSFLSSAPGSSPSVSPALSPPPQVSYPQVSPSTPSSSGSPRSCAANPVSAPPPTRSGRVSLPTSLLVGFISVSGGVGGSPARLWGGSDGVALAWADWSGVGLGRAGCRVFRPASCALGRACASCGVSVGLGGVVSLGRVPSPQRGVPWRLGGAARAVPHLCWLCLCLFLSLFLSNLGLGVCGVYCS